MNVDNGASDSVLARADAGYRATLHSQAIRIACKAASVVILARLVSPAEHGLFAMAASLTLVLVLFRDLGLGAAAIQRRTLDDEEKTTLFWAHGAIGVVLALLTVALAPAVAAFYGEPRVQALLLAMSASVLVIGFNVWPRVLLTRDMRFRELNALETLAVLTGTGAMIVVGAAGGGAYAFVAFLLVSEFMILVEAWRRCGWRPSAGPRWRSIRHLLPHGLDVTGYNVLLYFTQQVDTILMGRWFGASLVGLYTRPGQLLYLPHLHVAAPINQVLLSTLSRLEAGSPAFAAQVRASANLVAHLTLPLAAVCCAVPEEIVHLLLGADWLGAAPFLRWLAISAAATYLTAPVYAICVSTGRTRRVAAMAALTLLVLSVGLWLGQRHGPLGLAIALAVTHVALLLPRLQWTSLGTPVRLGDFAAAFAGPLAFASGLAVAMAAGRLVVAHAPWSVRLVAALACGACGGVLLAAAWPGLRRELQNVWRHRPGGRSAGRTAIP